MALTDWKGGKDFFKYHITKQDKQGREERFDHPLGVFVIPDEPGWDLEMRRVDDEDVKYIIEVAPHFRTIKLDRASLSEISIKELSALENISEFHYSGARERLEVFVKWKGLKNFHYHWSTQLSLEGMQDISQMALLEELHLGMCTSFKDEYLEPLGKLKKLKELTLLFLEQISDDGFKSISKNPRLESLFVSGIKNLRGTVFAVPGGFRKLQTLRVIHGSLEDDGLQAISKLQGLKKLDIRNSQNLTPAGFMHLSELKNLEELNVSKSKFNSENLTLLLELPNLRAVDLSDCPDTFNECLSILVKHPNSKDMKVRINDLADHEAFYIKDFNCFRDVDFGDRDIIRDDFLRYLTHQEDITKLDLRGCSASHVGFQYLSRLPALEELDVRGVSLFKEVIDEICKLKSLKRLIVFKNQLSEKDKEKLSVNGKLHISEW